MNADNPISHPNAQNPDERSRQPQKPGALHGQVWLTVQTNQAQQLIHGRAGTLGIPGTPDKPAIIGLIGFADRLRVIWLAARRDDPYADWWLIKIHEAINASETFISHQMVKLDKRLEQMTGMEVSVASSQRPYRIHLQFANPYAYRAAQLLARYDRLVCTALTARHIGLLDGDATVQVQQTCSRKLRALFMIPQGYRLMKIDRDMVHKAMGRSCEARQIMGAVPDDILSGEHQAPLVPRKVKFPWGFAGHVKLHPGSTDPDTHLSEDKNDDG
jgi:integrating conjugative element protein (TIGR03761 family)